MANFHTVTTNDSGTPGLAQVCLAFKIASMECHGCEELNDAKTYEG